MSEEFRGMRRFRQQVSKEACEKILDEQLRGVLAVQGENGYPYALPIDYLYKDGRIYFHGAKEGHKMDAIKACDKVSFCVWDDGFIKEGGWELNITSVIAFGRIRIVTDMETKKEVCIGIGMKFNRDISIWEEEWEQSAKRVEVLEIEIEHMTGKLVNEK